MALETSMSQIMYVLLVHIIVCSTMEGFEETKPKPKVTNPDQISASVINQSRKECVINVNETDLFSLQQLARSKLVHIVELDLNFPSTISNSVMNGWLWRMINDVGKEILSVLAMDNTRVTWSLTVGIKIKHVKITDDPSGCTASEKEPGALIAQAIVKQLSRDKEMCFRKNTSTQMRCCRTIGKDPVKSVCRASLARSEFVNILESTQSANKIFVRLALFPALVCIGILLLPKSTSNNNRERYYKLTETPMSLSSILFMLFWNGYGRIKSFVRRCLLIGFLFIFFCQTKMLDELNRFGVYFGIWAFWFPFSELLAQSSVPFVDSEYSFFMSRRCQRIFSLLHYCIEDDVVLLARTNVLGAMWLITLPFNIRRWKEMLLYIYKCTSAKRSELKRIWIYSEVGVLWLGHIVLVFIMQLIFVWLFTVDCYTSVILGRTRAIRRRVRLSILTWVMVFCELWCLFFTVYLLIFVLEYTPYVAISWLSGFFLNAVFFFPYLIAISILVFHSWEYWARVEEKYFVLMMHIYYIEQKNIEQNGMFRSSFLDRPTCCDMRPTAVDDEDHNDDKPEFVVAKELYDAIRERVLPYHENLFPFVFNILGISIYAVISFMLVRVLQASNVSSSIQLYTMLVVTVFPYIMTIVASNKRGKQMDVWKKQLRRSVEPLVKELAKKPRHSMHSLHAVNADEYCPFTQIESTV